jgi:hypothetical protein
MMPSSRRLRKREVGDDAVAVLVHFPDGDVVGPLLRPELAHFHVEVVELPVGPEEKAVRGVLVPHAVLKVRLIEPVRPDGGRLRTGGKEHERRGGHAPKSELRHRRATLRFRFGPVKHRLFDDA